MKRIICLIMFSILLTYINGECSSQNCEQCDIQNLATNNKTECENTIGCKIKKDDNSKCTKKTCEDYTFKDNCTNQAASGEELKCVNPFGYINETTACIEEEKQCSDYKVADNCTEKETTDLNNICIDPTGENVNENSNCIEVDSRYNEPCDPSNCTSCQFQANCEKHSSCEWLSNVNTCTKKKDINNAAFSISFKLANSISIFRLLSIIFTNSKKIQLYTIIVYGNTKSRIHRLLEQNEEISNGTNITAYILKEASENGIIDVSNMLNNSNVTEAVIKSEQNSNGTSLNATYLLANNPQMKYSIIEDNVNVSDAFGLFQNNKNAKLYVSNSLIKQNLSASDSNCSENLIFTYQPYEKIVDNGYVKEKKCENGEYIDSIVCDFGYELIINKCEQNTRQKTYKTVFVIFLVLFIVVFVFSSVLAYLYLNKKIASYKTVDNISDNVSGN